MLLGNLLFVRVCVCVCVCMCVCVCGYLTHNHDNPLLNSISGFGRAFFFFALYGSRVLEIEMNEFELD